MQVKIIKCHHLKEFLFWYDFALSTRKHIAHFPATIFIFIIFMPIFYCIRKTEYIYMYATYMYMYIHTELTENRQNICLFNNAYDMS